MQVYEQKVIGGIVSGLVSPATVDLTSADFESEDLGACLRIAKQLEATGTKIDADIIKLRLYETDQGFFGPDDFTLMAQSVSSASVVYDAVEKIKGSSLRTHLLTEAATIALHDKKSGSELLTELRNLVDSCEKSYSTSENSFVYLSDISPKTRGVIDDLHANKSYAVPTGFGNLDDELLDGFSRGDAHIIVGFTGAGKSAFALNCAMNQAAKGNVVGVVSREMSDTENHIRIIAGKANIPRFDIRMGLSEGTRTRLMEAVDSLDGLKIAFDTHTSNVEALRTQARKMVERDDMKILYVDYLQLMTSTSSQSSRANEVQAISRTLKLIAMENRIPVVSLCQFNRGAMNANLFEILGYLKESSGIEQDASTISYIQIEQSETPKMVKDAKVTILKNRNGATFNAAHFRYDGPTFTFTEVAKPDE